MLDFPLMERGKIGPQNDTSEFARFVENSDRVCSPPPLAGDLRASTNLLGVSLYVPTPLRGVFRETQRARAILGTVLPCQSRELATSRSCSDIEFSQDGHHRAPVRKGGLEQVCAHERSEEKPVRGYPMPQSKREQDESACNHAEIPFQCHDIASFSIHCVNIRCSRDTFLSRTPLAQIIENRNGHARKHC